jgi:integrase
VWNIPASRAKNGMAHNVPLSGLAIELLAKLKEVTHGAPKPRWLFPAPYGDKHITGNAVGNALRRNHLLLGTGNAVPHDLRRSAASHMTSLGISRLVVSKILNHVERGVTSVYDRFDYAEPKRQALDAWSARLRDIMERRSYVTNVVPLPARSG